MSKPERSLSVKGKHDTKFFMGNFNGMDYIEIPDENFWLTPKSAEEIIAGLTIYLAKESE